MESKDNNTFVRITNKDIYDKLESIERKVSITNGKVKLNRWIATTSLTLVVTCVIGLVVYILK